MRDKFSWCSCIFYLIVFLFYWVIAIWSVNYLLMLFFQKTLPIIAAMVIAVFTGEFTVPIAVVVYILRLCHIL